MQTLEQIKFRILQFFFSYRDKPCAVIIPRRLLVVSRADKIKIPHH